MIINHVAFTDNKSKQSKMFSLLCLHVKFQNNTFVRVSEVQWKAYSTEIRYKRYHLKN